MDRSIRQKIAAETGETNARFVLGLLADVEAGRRTPQSARQVAEATVRYSRPEVKEATTRAIHEHLRGN